MQIDFNRPGKPKDNAFLEPFNGSVRADTPPETIEAMRAMGYRVDTEPKTSGPITAIWIDRAHGTLWDAASDYGEDTGVAW